jgi:hypothetical protein
MYKPDRPIGRSTRCSCRQWEDFRLRAYLVFRPNTTITATPSTSDNNNNNNNNNLQNYGLGPLASLDAESFLKHR